MPLNKSERIRPDTRVSDLARSPLLDTLSMSELAVLLRLIAASRTQGSHVNIINSELHQSRRTAQRALTTLCAFGLVRVHLDDDTNARTVELLCL
jgi:predicted transcriptional regulator